MSWNIVPAVTDVWAPHAAHCQSPLAVHQAFSERAVIMAALGPDREHLLADADQQHLFPADMAGEHAAVGHL